MSELFIMHLFVALFAIEKTDLFSKVLIDTAIYAMRFSSRPPVQLELSTNSK